MTKTYAIGEEMQMIVDQVAMLRTFRARKADAELRTPGGKLTDEDLRGVIRTTANIHLMKVPTVVAVLMAEGDLTNVIALKMAEGEL
jgi:hypothetical protein